MAYSNFKYKPEFYHPESVGAPGAPSYKDRRKEYQRLYSVARKRLERFESSGLTNALAYQLNKGLKPSTELNDQQIAYELDAVYRMLSSEQGSVTGYKKVIAERVERLQDNGLDFVTKKNYAAFQDFMETWRTSENNTLYSSEQVAQMFGTAVSKGIDPDKLSKDFDFYMENRKAIEKLPRARSGGKNEKALKDLKKSHGDKVRRKLDESVQQQAIRWGINPRDFDTEYFRRNIKILEKMEPVYGKTARQIKNDIATGKRRKTMEKNKRKKKR